jgi:hypothetical protein
MLDGNVTSTITYVSRLVQGQKIVTFVQIWVIDFGWGQLRKVPDEERKKLERVPKILRLGEGTSQVDRDSAGVHGRSISKCTPLALTTCITTTIQKSRFSRQKREFLSRIVRKVLVF